MGTLINRRADLDTTSSLYYLVCVQDGSTEEDIKSYIRYESGHDEDMFNYYLALAEELKVFKLTCKLSKTTIPYHSSILIHEIRRLDNKYKFNISIKMG
jgi:hypothetical protein